MPAAATITLQPWDVQIAARPGETVLEALLRHRLRVFHGCTMGGCGACTLRLLAGSVSFGRYSKDALSDAERENGRILSCRCVPAGDIEICLLEPHETRFPRWMRDAGSAGNALRG